MSDIVERRSAEGVPASEFREGYVDADGFRIRYCEAGEGEPVISLHGAGGMHLYRSHELLAKHHRMIVFEVPGFGQSPANERSGSMQELGLTMARAAGNLGIDRFNLMGNSFGGKLALWLAVQQPERLDALVLIAPAAIRPEGS
ncbi:MAG: alpha/beta fold hydrolase, partial [Chloroflexota bacterium]|nr:alpha/beta fold hydrolase [Chloroflexota bacterium]